MRRGEAEMDIGSRERWRDGEGRRGSVRGGRDRGGERGREGKGRGERVRGQRVSGPQGKVWGAIEKHNIVGAIMYDPGQFCR